MILNGLICVSIAPVNRSNGVLDHGVVVYILIKDTAGDWVY